MNVVLVGFRAVGKTSVGSLLAKELGMGFLDTDKLLEERIGEIHSFVKKNGWKAFRRMEASIIHSLANLDGYVIATGGGSLEAVENLNIIRSLGRVVWLKAPVSKILERMDLYPRPALTPFEPKKEVEFMLRKRAALYLEVADLVLDTGHLDPAEATKVLKLAIQELEKEKGLARE